MTPTEIRNAVCTLQAQGHSLREISRSHGEAFALARPRIVLIMVLQTQEREVILGVIRGVPIKVRDLSGCHGQILVQMKAQGTPPTAFKEDAGLDFRRERFAGAAGHRLNFQRV
jgi:hypothetical protein